MVGTSVTIQELDGQTLDQTGKSFKSSIKNDMGEFTVKGVNLVSQYALLEVNGYYRNEVTGQNAKPIVIGGGTYARVLPCGVAFGPCFPDSDAGIHCADEYIDLIDFDKSIEIYYRAIKALCF